LDETTRYAYNYIIQTYSNLFDDEIAQAEAFAKNGDYDKAAIELLLER
jgi:hypothetical protein